MAYDKVVDSADLDAKLTAIAEAIRAKTGKTDALTLEQMLTEIASIQSGGSTIEGGTGSALLGTIVETVALRGVEVSVTAETFYLHALYNGVRLPIIPESVLKSYPYCIIRKGIGTGYYEMYCTIDAGYRSGDNINYSNATKVKYRVAIETMETATEWEDNGTTTSTIIGIDTTRPVIWSNYDIPNGSATATDIYLEATEPVPTD